VLCVFLDCVKVDWTPELHRRFVQAVEQLGVDKAVPSRILEIIGIDCLTRHNIASHLQVHILQLSPPSYLQSYSISSTNFKFRNSTRVNPKKWKIDYYYYYYNMVAFSLTNKLIIIENNEYNSNTQSENSASRLSLQKE